MSLVLLFFFFFSSRRRHTRCSRDWSSDVCSSELLERAPEEKHHEGEPGHTGPEVVVRHPARHYHRQGDRKSVVYGKSVDLGGRRIIKKKNKINKKEKSENKKEIVDSIEQDKAKTE